MAGFRFWARVADFRYWTLVADFGFWTLMANFLDTSRLFWILGTDSSDSSDSSVVVPRIEVCLHDITDMVVFEQT